jgi:hypothetical protein
MKHEIPRALPQTKVVETVNFNLPKIHIQMNSIWISEILRDNLIQLNYLTNEAIKAQGVKWLSQSNETNVIEQRWGPVPPYVSLVFSEYFIVFQPEDKPCSNSF